MANDDDDDDDDEEEEEENSTSHASYEVAIAGLEETAKIIAANNGNRFDQSVLIHARILLDTM